MATGMLRGALDAIRGSEKPTTVPGFLRPIDTAGIARELNLDVMAAERGRSNTPATGSTTLDAVEQQLLQKIESEWAWQGGELINNLRAYTQRLIGYSVESEFSRLEVMAKDTLAKLREADHRAEAELGPLREKYVSDRNELADFRKKHRLTRAARLPAHRWITFGILLLLIAFESAVNGLFFAKGNEFGLVGGIGTAVILSLINVSFCFLLGLFPLRWINRRSWFLKAIGLLITPSVGAGILVLHAFASHYRDATAAVGEDKAIRAAIASLYAHPWQLADLYSYALFAMGLLFTFLSVYKGATFDDPYPSYGAVTRRHNVSRDEYSDEHSDLFDDLKDIKDQTVATLNDGILKIPLYPQQAANIRAQRAALVESFRGYEATVQSAGNQLLARYRDINRKWRTTPMPGYTEEQWRLPHSFLQSAEVRTLMSDHDDEQLDMHATLAELRRLSHEVLTEYERLMLTYPHPTKMA